MRVTSKGQVTIPKAVRRHLGIHAGSEVAFELRNGEAVLYAPSDTEREREVAEFMNHLRSYRGSLNLGGMTSDEFMSFLRD